MDEIVETLTEAEDTLRLLKALVPELKAIRDCQGTYGKTATVRPDDAAIQAADFLLIRLGHYT